MTHNKLGVNSSEEHRNIVGRRFLEVYSKSFMTFESIDGDVYAGYSEGLLYYKENHGYLRDPQRWSLIESDENLTPTARVFRTGRHMFVERGYNVEGSKRDAAHFFELRRLSQLSKSLFQVAFFETPIGLFINKNDFEGRLFHTYSGSVKLHLLAEFPEYIKRELTKLLAHAMKEIHDLKVDYHDPISLNLRYSFRNKIIFSPHNCLRTEASQSETERDLARLLRTCKLLDSTDEDQVKEFLKDYLWKDFSTKKLAKLSCAVRYDMELLEP